MRYYGKEYLKMSHTDRQAMQNRAFMKKTTEGNKKADMKKAELAKKIEHGE